MADIPIGIDLGTTYSCVAVFREGALEVIPNLTGKRTTPSYVAYVGDKRLVGDKAKSQATVNPENTIFDVKRLIGRRFEEQTVQDDIKIWPFQVVNTDEGFPRIQVTINEEEKLIHPIQVSAAILSYLKEAAEEYLNSAVERAVVTVPSYFNDHQRQATKDAATMAGLVVMRIINEPTAAAIAYGFNLQEQDINQTVLLFDLGGGTFDVTLMQIEDGIFTVLSTSGDTHLGGEDFTGRLVAHCIEDLRTRLEKDVTQDKRALGRIRVECERVKVAFSEQDECIINVENLMDGLDYELTVSLQGFEDMCGDLFDRLPTPIERALHDANVMAVDVDKVALVGGGCRMRRVRTLVAGMFGGREPMHGVNVDEAVACGAALQASRLAGNVEEALQAKIVDVLPLSLGVDDAAGDIYVVIARNTTIPVEASLEFTTYNDNQEMITFDLYEGERPIPKENNLLGTFRISGLTAGPRGKVTVDVTVNVDSDGLCTVTGAERLEEEEEEEQQEAGEPVARKEPAKLCITNVSRRALPSTEIDRMIVEAKVYEEDDRKERRRLLAKAALENLCLKLKSEITYNTNGPNLKEEIRDAALQICNDTLVWLFENKAAKEEVFTQRTAEVKEQLGEIFAEENQ